MIFTIRDASRVAEQATLQSMFSDRKTLFVDLFGWDIPVVEDRFEIDQFDDDDTVYLIAVDDAGSHDASLRLLRTDRPHMLDTLFPHLCPLGVPVGPSIWESTRLCLPQRHGAVRRRELRNQLISAMVDFALLNGIDCYTGVLPEAFRNEVVTMGWRAELLGPAIRIPGGPIGAFAAHISSETPERLRWTGVYAPVLENPQ